TFTGCILPPEVRPSPTQRLRKHRSKLFLLRRLAGQTSVTKMRRTATSSPPPSQSGARRVRPVISRFVSTRSQLYLRPALILCGRRRKVAFPPQKAPATSPGDVSLFEFAYNFFQALEAL